MDTTVFWSCTGMDASELSYSTAKLFSEEENTLMVELPCLGIPRLGFTCGVMDAQRNTETAILRFDRDKRLQWDMIHQINKRFHILPASVFSVPDYPVAARVNVDTLMEFIFALQKLARDHDCGRLVLDCQGQLNSPMTFFSLKAAGQAVIPLGKPSDAAYAVASVRRLVQAYQQQPAKFLIAVIGSVKSIESAALAGGQESEKLNGIRFVAWDSRKVKRALTGNIHGPADLSGRAQWGALLKKEANTRAPKDNFRETEGRQGDQMPDGMPVYL